MKNKSQILVDLSDDFPIQISTIHITEPEHVWHMETVILFILQGETDIVINDTSSHLIPEDVILINSNEMYQIISNHCEILSLKFSLERLQYINHNQSSYFSLNSSGETDSHRYNHIRYILANFIKVNTSGEIRYKSLSLLYSLVGHLTEYFSATPMTKISSASKNHQRITSITQFINKHYDKCLTLSDVADSQNLSVPYLSSFFKNNTGLSFLSYYNDIRLSHAVNMMLISNESLENIAIKSGFRDSRSFVSVFKKKYQCLPSEFRSRHLEHPADNFQKQEIPLETVDNTFENLAKYLNIYSNDDSKSSYNLSEISLFDIGNIDCKADGIQLKHKYRSLMCVGSARQFLYHEVQEMISKVQREIHYDYVKFHGMLSDEMMVYDEKPDGTPVYSFSLLDKVFDFLINVGLKPLCQLSFMPVKLSSNPNRMVDMNHFNTAPPKDMKKWTDLVYATIKHFIQRYGLNEVRSWLFCVWNEPDGTISDFYWEEKDLFFKFYELTYKTVKSLDEKLTFGTPSMLVSLVNETGWASDFFRYCRNHSCTPEFINMHYYDNSFVGDNPSKEYQMQTSGNLSKTVPLNSNPYAFLQYINDLKMSLKKYHMGNLPIYLTEWNLTISHRDLINDTCFKACYLTKNLLENYDRLESFGYWCLTDFIEELQLPNELYHGGLGMFTYNGIPKAHFNVFKFLTHLEDELLGKGNGYFITKGNNKIVILLYNYEHYSKLFASGILFDMSNNNRYTPFTEMNDMIFQVSLNGLDSTSCLIKEMFVNQNYGSSYDAWVRMGAQPLSRDDDLDLLRQQSQPGMYLHRETITSGTLLLETQLAPLEVRLVEIELDF